MNIKDELRRVAKSYAASLIADPRVRIEEVECERIELDTFEKAESSTAYIVTLRTNDISMLRGQVDSFTGNYKERVEAVLQHTLDVRDSGSRVSVEIVGQDSGRIQKIVSIEELIASGRVQRNSPLARIAAEYGIDSAILRGRHIVGPSPAIARAVEHLIRPHSATLSVLDLFSGTMITARVILRHNPRPRIVCVDCDSRKFDQFASTLPEDCVKRVVCDAFEFQPVEKFDLTVADPFYEDALAFLDARGAALREKTEALILCSGGSENRSWNQRVELQLRSLQFETSITDLFGRRIFIGH